jgi:hypothetical protein
VSVRLEDRCEDPPGPADDGCVGSELAASRGGDMRERIRCNEPLPKRARP